MNGRSKLGALVVAWLLVLGAGEVALAQVEWTIGDVVVPPGPPGSWDEGRHMRVGVVFDGTTYHMYLTGGPGNSPIDNTWQIGHWTWNGVDWEEDANPVLAVEPGQWDGYSIGSAAVLYHEGMFHMWYGAAATPLGPCNVGYATSPDGSLWTKYAGNPLEGLAPGPPGTWYDTWTSPATVVVEGSTLRMWYYASEGGTWPGTWRIGHATSNATSTDFGTTWTRDPDPVLEGSGGWEDNQVYLPTVVFHGGSYHMWYTGRVAGVSVRIGYADSSDGLAWRRWPGNPVLTGIGMDSIAVLLDGNTIHGWVSQNPNIRTATSSWFFADDFETGTTDAWSLVMP